MRFAVIAAMAVFAAALYGWGWGFRKLFRMDPGAWAVTLALGLAILVFLGGILNLARIAYWPLLAALVLLGLIGAFNAWHSRFGHWRSFREHLQASAGSGTTLALGLSAAFILAIVVATALPPAAYNTVDDYGKYFFHPVYMLAYGTLYGSPLSDLGSETLGAKAFIDGFAVSLFPLKYLDASDAVFGLFLCFAVAAGFSRAKNGLAGVAVLAVLAVFFIDPQSINISALYLGAALMMAAIALTADVKETATRLSPAALGVVYAALIALKTSFALFVLLHGMAVALVLSIHERSALKGLRFALAAAGFSVLFLSPWIALHAPHYLAALRDPRHLPDLGLGPPDRVTPLTIAPLVYGSTAAQYTLTMLLALAAATVPLALKGRGAMSLSAAMTAAAGAAGFAAYIVTFFVLGPLLSGYGEAVRYAVPLFIGIVPAILALLAFHVSEAKEMAGRFAKTLPWIFAVLVLVIFAPSVFVRVAGAMEEGAVPAFPFARSPQYAMINSDAIGQPMQDEVRKLQALIPPGATVTVWMGAPFFLDLGRNKVLAIDSAGLATPWAAFPETDYVIWEYGGYARPLVSRGDVEHSGVIGAHERLIAAEEWTLSNRLAKWALQGTILYRDRRFVLFAPSAAP